MESSLQSKVDQLKPQQVVVVEEEKAPNTTAENTEEVHVKVCVEKPLVALIYSVDQMIPPIPWGLYPHLRGKL
jgi:hypothetical protein